MGHGHRRSGRHSASTLLEGAEREYYSGNYAEAYRLAQRAGAAVTAPRDRQEAALLAAEAALMLDRLSDARRSLAKIDPARCALGGRHALLDLGDAYLNAGAHRAARTLFERMVDSDSSDADAYYGLGLAAHELGDSERGREAWLRCRRLDLEAPRPSWAPGEDDYETLAEAALAELPPRALSLLENVPVFVAPSPSQQLVADGVDPRLLGLFSGIPYPEQSAFGQALAPDAVHIFTRNLERVCERRSQLEEEIRTTVLHETAHYFGLDDDELDELGLG